MSGIDLALLGIATALVAIGALLLWFSPVWWGRYLELLDVRVWPLWKVIGLVVVLVEILVVVRCWPNAKRRQPRDEDAEKICP
ncbi:MAG: hypothetical protein ABFC77_08920 [Thermoguttaceae bacterium]